jgi:hypothetical protein
MSLLLARARLRSESRALSLRGAPVPAAEVSAVLSLTYADMTALVVLAAVLLWAFRSEPPRVLVRALRKQTRPRPMNVEDTR